MAVATPSALASPCLGCGELVDPDVAFCPGCGTRLVADRPLPVRATPMDTERLARSANAWIAVAVLATAILLFTVGLLVGTVTTTFGDDGDAPGDSQPDDAADTMDAYAPLAETWAEKDRHVADEASGDDPNGLAVAAEDARLWIDLNRGDLAALVADADGAAAPLYQQLLGVFDERSATLADIEATATAGGSGEGAAADEVASLAVLEQQADGATCDIAEIMRAEGDDPDDHITPEMDVAC